MSVFEFAFSLFGLLLGLSLAEVLGGFARSVEARKSARLGWLTPMLAILMLMDVVSFWGAGWLLRDHITFSVRFLMGATAFAGAYYVGAYLVFPRDLADQEDLDDHYMLVRRPVLGIIAVANFAQLLLFLAIRGWALLSDTLMMGLFVAFELLCLANMFTEGKRSTPAVLAITVALYLFMMLR